MSDDELDKDWKPNGRRPQSTMAKSFSAALDDMFKMDNSIADLDAAVSEKKHAVVTQASELEELEARLRATEERLKANGLEVAPRSPIQRIPLEDIFGQPESTEQTDQTSTSPSAQQSKQASRPTTATRPGTGKARDESYTNPPMPGGLPPTPGDSEDGHEIDEDEAEPDSQAT